MKLISITIQEQLSPENLMFCDQKAFLEFGCLGKHDYSMEEEEVDVLLGKDAFCGGDLSEEMIDKIEGHMSKQKGQSYFWDRESESLAKSFQKSLLEKGFNCSQNIVEERDWNSEWRKHFKAISVSDKLTIIPSWEKDVKSDYDLFIYPGMGFGTGNHETTFLCLKIYESLELRFENVLDFGCGSGILGIAPMKHYNSDVTFVDIDKAALDNCVMNLQLNDHEDYNGTKDVVLRDRFSSSSKKYDLIFANILRPVLLSEKGILFESLAPGGYLIVSGLLKEQCDEIISSYNELEHIETLDRGDWSAIAFRSSL